MRAWINGTALRPWDRPTKRPRRNQDGLQQLQLPLHAPTQELHDTKAEADSNEAPRGACEVDFYI